MIFRTMEANKTEGQKNINRSCEGNETGGSKI